MGELKRDKKMQELMILIFAMLGVFFVVVFLVSRLKRVSIEEILSIVWKWLEDAISCICCRLWEYLRSNNEPYFQLYEEGFDKVFDIVAKHSRLSKEDTLWQNQGEHISFQLLPVNAQSVAAASQEAKVYIRNEATEAGCGGIDIDSWDAPGADGTRILHIYMATTTEQRSKLAEMRKKRARLNTLQAGADMQPFVDEGLDAEQEPDKKDGGDDEPKN